jgi:large subunit ribosomal protein L21
MYAIVKTGGKQYRVQTGQQLLIERLAAEAGAEVALEPILYRDDDAVLDPAGLERVKVTAKVIEHVRGEKLRVFKFKPKRGYRRRTGHRQALTRIEVSEITAQKAKAGAARPGEAEAADAKAAEAKPSVAEAATAKAGEAKAPAAKGRAQAKPKAKAPARSTAKPAQAKPKAPAAGKAKPGTEQRKAKAAGRGKAKAGEPAKSAEEPSKGKAAAKAKAKEAPAKPRDEKGSDGS